MRKSPAPLVPAVAESWQTEDNKAWIFTLRENAKLSNGEPITASDFLANLGKHFLNLKAQLKVVWLL